MLQTPKLAVRRSLPLAVCLLLLSVSSSHAATTLRWKFEPGQILHQIVVQDMKMTMKIRGRTIVTNITQTMDATWKVGAVDAQGTAEITQTFDRIQMKMTAAGAPGFEFDSDKDQELTGIGAMLGPSLKAMAKSKFELKMTTRGEIVAVEVSQETADALKKLPGAGAMGGLFSKDGMIAMIKKSSQAFPEQPLEKGDDWTTKTEIEMPNIGAMAADTKLTYAGPEEVEGKQLEKLDVSITMAIKPKVGGQTQVNLKEQDASGVIYFDNAAGRIDHSEIVQNMTLQVMVAGNNFTQEILQTISTRLTPAKKASSKK